LSALVAKRIRVPNYDHVSKERDFGSYALLQGTELRENVFKALPAPIQNVLVRDIGHFLSELHALPLAFVHLREDDGRWDSEGIWRYSDRYANEKRGVIKSFVEPKLLSELDDFFERLRNMQSTIRRVIHADVTDDHLLVNSEGKFAGVIDFGDATIGDPAFDFSYFWKYGDRVPAAVYANYTFKDDEKLLDRSRWHFVRYLSDRLFGAVEAHDFDLSEQITGTMQTALSRLPPLC
jgi:aminoglycoside 2''-phosphotransferase